MIHDDRKKRLLGAMAEAGIDMLLIYGNAWQADYLRYTTDYSIVEGQALALVRGDGHVTLYLDSHLESDRAEIDCPGLEIVLAHDLVGEVDRALDRFRNQRIGAAPARLLPRRLAKRAQDLQLADQTAFLDRLLMRKMESEIAVLRRAAKLADEGYAVFRDAARPGRADYELIAEIEAFFRANGPVERAERTILGAKIGVVDVAIDLVSHHPRIVLGQPQLVRLHADAHQVIGLQHLNR